MKSLSSKTKKFLRLSAITAAIVGALVSGYALNHHYDEGEAFCDVSESLSCSTVNRSVYSEFLGIPVAAMGLLTYTLITLLLLLPKTKKEAKYPLALSFIALVFQGYLTYIEFAVLQSACILCIISQIVIIIIAAATWTLYKNPKEENPATPSLQP